MNFLLILTLFFTPIHRHQDFISDDWQTANTTFKSWLPAHQKKKDYKTIPEQIAGCQCLMTEKLRDVKKMVTDESQYKKLNEMLAPVLALHKAPNTICLYKGELNAYFIPSHDNYYLEERMLSYTSEELQFLIGHELGHGITGYGIRQTIRYIPEQEREFEFFADLVGAWTVRSVNPSVTLEGVLQAFKRLPVKGGGKTHPSHKERFSVLAKYWGAWDIGQQQEKK